MAIIGAGSIGILLSQSVKTLAAEKVLISDISDLSLKIAKKVGVDFIVNKKNKVFGELNSWRFWFR